MKNKDIHLNIDLSSLPTMFGSYVKKFSAYRVLAFFLMVASLYGYIVWRINVLSNAPASQSEETAQTTAQPRIDASTVQKIQSLQDNSVSVQSLFNQARQNPFQE